MKKFLALVLAVLLLIPSFTMVTSAAGGSLSVGVPASAKSGDTFSVTIKLNSNPGVIALRLNVSYSSHLELVGVSDAGLLAGYVTPGSYQSPATLYWSNGTATSNNTASGTVATLTFKGTAVGTESIQVSCAEAYNVDLNSISFSSGSSNVSITCSHSGTMTHHAKVNATCSKTGTIEYWSCSACAKNFSDDAGNNIVSNLTIPVDASSHSFGNYTGSESTHAHSCTLCGKSETSAHTYDTGTETTPATCKDEGVKTYTCTACGETKTEAIPKLTTHTWDSGKLVKKATKTQEAEYKYTCTVCGETKTEKGELKTEKAETTSKSNNAKTNTTEEVSATVESNTVKTATIEINLALFIVLIAIIVLALGAVVFLIFKKKGKH